MHTDLAIIGSGSAGCALALRAADAGLRVTLIDAAKVLRRKPGETLHPGVEPLLAQLGVREQFIAAGFHRQNGIRVQWGGPEVFKPYGEDADGPWRGFQAERVKFETLLLEAVKSNERVSVLRPCRAVRPLQEGGRVVGIETTQGEIHSRWVADAGGGTHWLAGMLGVKIDRHSSPLRVSFGWENTPGQNEIPENPILSAENDGWFWKAPLGGGDTAWCRLRFSECARISTSVSDVTWRCAAQAAGAGWFLLGDAAAVLDPASSHGVLRALMGGLMVGHLLEAVNDDRCNEALAAEIHTEWIRDQFKGDVRSLSLLYASHPSRPDLVL